MHRMELFVQTGMRPGRVACSITHTMMGSHEERAVISNGARSVSAKSEMFENRLDEFGRGASLQWRTDMPGLKEVYNGLVTRHLDLVEFVREAGARELKWLTIAFEGTALASFIGKLSTAIMGADAQTPVKPARQRRAGHTRLKTKPKRR